MQLNTEFVTQHYAVLRTSKHKNIRHVKSCSSKHKVSRMLNYTSLLSWSMIRRHDQNLLLCNYCSYPQSFIFHHIKSYHTCNSFPVPNKVHSHLPAIPLKDLCHWACIIHCMCWYHIMSVRWPTETKNMGGAAAFSKWLSYFTLLLPIRCSPNLQSLVIGLRGKIFSNRIPSDAFDHTTVAL